MAEENNVVKKADEIILGGEATYAEFVRLLERAEEEGKLPYKCPHCDFTTTMLTEVFYHRAEDCARLNFCNLCGFRSPDVYHYLLHGFECLWEGNFNAPEDDSVNIPNTLPENVSEIEDVDTSLSTRDIEPVQDVIDIENTEITDDTEDKDQKIDIIENK